MALNIAIIIYMIDLYSEGHEDDILLILNSSLPEHVCMPGNLELSADVMIKETLPPDLSMDMDLTKLTPYPMHVPCLEGVSIGTLCDWNNVENELQLSKTLLN